ncbi:MAG: hypothetical protein J7527_13655 [Chitinophagaceae bacterium]|nr:hypothetical protein [Chitinophagaceae bacterium]
MLFFLHPVSASAQVKEIVKVLNREQLKDLQAREKGLEQSCGEQFELVRKFQVEGNVLSIEVRRANGDSTEFYIEKQEVDLSKVKAIVKDINVLFQTDDDAVTITTTYASGKKDFDKGSTFFLYLSCGKENEALAKRIAKAFKKAGWPIEIGVWAD